MFVLLQIVAPSADPAAPPFLNCPMIELHAGVPSEFIATRDDRHRKPQDGDYRLETTVYGKPQGDDGIALTVDVQLARFGMDTLLLYDDPEIESGSSVTLVEGKLSVVVYAWRGHPDAAGLATAQAGCNHIVGMPDQPRRASTRKE